MKIYCVGDIHLREDAPICRTDTFFETQLEKLVEINRIANENYVLCPGDVFHKWKTSPRLLNAAINFLPYHFITTYGNHDLPGHNIERKNESGLGVLASAYPNDGNSPINVLCENNSLHILPHIRIDSYPFGCDLKNSREFYFTKEDTSIKIRIALVHKFIYIKKEDHHVQDGVTDTELFGTLKGYDLIVIGDNHTPGTFTYGKSTIINSGSLTRQRASETHEPRIYEWDTETRKTRKIILDHNPNAVARDHLELKEKIDSRINAFVSKLSMQIDSGLSFEDNLKEFFKKNKTPKELQTLVLNILENES
jgi:DNA repair exonuclease SbcCD nuclease subunit